MKNMFHDVYMIYHGFCIYKDKSHEMFFSVFSGKLRTLALRPNVMYGELDPYYVTNGLRSAKTNEGILTRVGDGSALFQQAYVGNVAWAHVLAASALKKDAETGGKVYFITDDTPLLNTFDFMKIFLLLKGFDLSSYAIPYPLMYVVLYCLESVLYAISPVKKINLPTALCSVIYINKTYYFNRKRAENMLGYKPIYDFDQSIELSAKYYQDVFI